MNPPQIIFPVGAGGSSLVIAAARSHLLALSTAIQQHVGKNPSACWYPIRSHCIYGPSCFLLDIDGDSDILSVVLLPAHETRLPTSAELAQKLPTRTLVLPVADPTDAFYLTLFLFDDLALRPAFDPERTIVPASIRHGLGVFSCP